MLTLAQIDAFQCSEETLRKFDLPVKDKKDLVNLVNDSIYRKCAKSNKEKFDLLDLRDKLLKLIRYETNSLLSQSASNAESQTATNDSSTNLIGTCDDMCPERERYSRECLALFHRYEIRHDSSTNTDIVDHRLMIKEFSRSSADQDLPLPNEMRPIHVLYGTMMYLIDDVIAKIANEDALSDTEFSYGDWYDFIWNRTRSLRKDIIQQRLLLKGPPSQVMQNIKLGLLKSSRVVIDQFLIKI